MKTLVIANQKGGVGKTTSAINISHYFAMRGKRVLLIDLDSQGHVSTGLNRPKSNGLYKLLVEKENFKQVAIEARPNLFIIPNDHTSIKVEESVNNTPFREYLLNEILQSVTNIDLIILDTPPSTNILHILALVASDFVITPSKMDFLSLDGVGYLLKTINSLSRYPSVTPPVFVGVLPTFFDRLTNITRSNLAQLQNSIGEAQILNPIPTDTKIREASSYGMTIWEYAPKSQSAIGYKSTSRIKNSEGRTGGYLHIVELLSNFIF